MRPALHNGDIVLVNRLVYNASKPKRGDVIAFKPNGNENAHYSIKRGRCTRTVAVGSYAHLASDTGRELFRLYSDHGTGGVDMKFVLDIQLFASKKGVGSTKNGRDSHSKRLGAKLADGQFAHAGSIIYRQRGTKIHPGTNVGRGGDDTLFAMVNGVVKYERMGKDRKKVSVYPQA